MAILVRYVVCVCVYVCVVCMCSYVCVMCCVCMLCVCARARVCVLHMNLYYHKISLTLEQGTTTNESMPVRGL